MSKSNPLYQSPNALQPYAGFVRSQMGVPKVYQRDSLNMAWYKNHQKKKRKKNVVESAPTPKCLFWFIRNEQSNRFFRDEEHLDQVFKDLFLNHFLFLGLGPLGV